MLPPLPVRSMIQPTLYGVPDAAAPPLEPLVPLEPVVPPVLEVVADEPLCELEPHADATRAVTPTSAPKARRALTDRARSSITNPPAYRAVIFKSQIPHCVSRVMAKAAAARKDTTDGPSSHLQATRSAIGLTVLVLYHLTRSLFEPALCGAGFLCACFRALFTTTQSGSHDPAVL